MVTQADYMRAAIVDAPHHVQVRDDVPLPAPGRGEVLVRLEGSGVCGSNLPVWLGRPWFTYPLDPGAPGHEGWGCVVRLGPDTAGVARGARVAMLATHAYAEYDVAPASAVVTLPPELDAMPCPGEPLACAVNVFRRSGIESGQQVAIVGIGFLGALLTQLCVHAGATVTALSRRACAVDMALRLGAAAGIRLSDGDLPSAVARQAAPVRFDRVIEAAGTQCTLDLAAELTAERGRLIIAGYHQDGPRQVDMQMWNWRGLDVINAHERDPQVYVDGMRAALALVAGGTLDPTPLYTHTFPLAELDEAFTLMDTRPVDFFKALVLA